MKKNDVKGFSIIANIMNFKEIPYFGVKTLVYRSGVPNHIYFKTKFSDTFSEGRIIKGKKTRKLERPEDPIIPKAKVLRQNIIEISKEKAKDIESMYPYMPGIDIHSIKQS